MKNKFSLTIIILLAFLAQAADTRFKSGAITEVDAHQSKLEAESMFNNMLSKESDLQDALIQLAFMQGNREMQLPVKEK